jgi:hypothetical protein
MNEPSKSTSRYAWGGAVVLCLLAILGWFAFRQEPSTPNQQPVKADTVKPIVAPGVPAFKSDEISTNGEMVRQSDVSAITNAADLYRQAFALYDPLSKDEKGLLGDWRTNVDVSVEAELCGKIQPICDLMHQAAAVTNCDWGIVTLDKVPWPHLGQSRAIARAAIWSAAHCRSNDVTGATDDALSVLRLGHQVSQSAIIGSLVDIALQGLASSYVSQNIALFQGNDAQRVASAFDDQSYAATISRALQQEADMVERQVAELAEMSDDDLRKHYDGTVDRSAMQAEYQQVADSERALAKALADSSEVEYEAWRRQAAQIQDSNPLGATLSTFDMFLNKVQGAEVNRAMVVAALAVAQGSVVTLQSNPDPSSGQPFLYTETANGFELQSPHQVNGQPMTMQFRLR